MSDNSKIVHTARTYTRGGREHGVARSADGYLDVRLAAPHSGNIGTSPEHLFAAAWSACLQHAIKSAARRTNVNVPTEIAIDAEMRLNVSQAGGYFLSADFNVSIPGIGREQAQALVDEAHATCPYSKATRENIDVQIKLREPPSR